MENQIRTSVIIPVYNTENYLDECIQSVLNQTQKEIEIILVDDGSTDSSGEIIERYAREYDNIIVIHQENQKLGTARNNGFKHARGDYVYFLDSDDFIANDTLEKCYMYAKKEKLDFLFFDAWEFFDKENIFSKGYNRSNRDIKLDIYEGRIYWKKYYKNGGVISCAPLTYIDRKYMNTNSLFFEEGIFYEDMDWILRMYRNAKRIAYYPQKLYYRRYREDSITQQNYSRIHFNSVLLILFKLIELYINYEDIASKQMVENIFDMMIVRMQEIIKIIDISLICNELFTFIKRLLSEDDKLNLLNENMKVKISILLKVCQKYINIESFENLDLVNRYNLYKTQIFNCIKNKYKLQESINIGICGIGKMCNEIFDWYERNEISINANIKFIVTKTESNTYKGYPVYEIEKIKNLEFDHIIIASTKFADEMQESLQANNIIAKEYFITYGSLNDY